MSSASPNKRRALASLNANAMSPRPRPRESKILSPSRAPFSTASTEDAATSAKASSLAVLQPEPASAKKRCLEVEEGDLEGKRSRVVEETVDQYRSASPEDESSFFDTTVSSTGEGDSSWTTNITEPDMAPVVNLRRRTPLTREQAREKAEMLKARLGLASYKLRTGQTGMSLAQLEAKQKTAGTSTTTKEAHGTIARDEATTTAGRHTADVDVEGQQKHEQQDEQEGISNEDVAMADGADRNVPGQDQRTYVESGARDQAENGLLSLARSASELSQMASSAECR